MTEELKIESLFQPAAKEITTEVCILSDGRTLNFSPEKLIKFEKSIKALVARREMDDGILVQAIEMQASSLVAYSRNIKSWAEKCDFGNTEENVKLLKQGIVMMEGLLIECREKANDNQ